MSTLRMWAFIALLELLSAAQLKILTIERKPYVMHDSSRTGNDRFTGFLVELFQTCVRTYNSSDSFEYVLANFSSTGIRQSNGAWNGLIGEVVAGNADLILNILSVTVDRMESLDLTRPFENGAYGILLRLPQATSQKIAFFYPFQVRAQCPQTDSCRATFGASLLPPSSSGL